jgi:aryl-alcohol dehydrogenase-like predicted oxidoreductase
MAAGRAGGRRREIAMDGVASAGEAGLQLPRLGLGAMTWGDPGRGARWTPAQLAYGGSDGRADEEEALAVSLAAGARLVDTAALYGRGASERRVGELALGRDVLIATKFPPSMLARAGSLPQALDGSLARLQRDRVDLYQIHYPMRWMSIPTLMELMADAVEAGKVRAVGVSNYTADQMREAHAALARRGIPLTSNQVQYSLLYRQPEVDGVLDACRELNVTLIAYSPLAAGALTGKYSTTAPTATGLRRLMRTFRPAGLREIEPVVARLRAIGERYGMRPGQVALRWLLEDPRVLPIPGAKNGRQAAQNAGALSFSLTPEERESLDEATLDWRR